MGDAFFSLTVSVMLGLAILIVAAVTSYRPPILIDGRFQDWEGLGRSLEDAVGDVESTSSDVVATHRYSRRGTYEASLTVKDTAGYESQVSLSVTVPNGKPRAEFVYSMEDANVSFDASPSWDPEGSELDYVWDFGDGNGGVGPSATHFYDRRGYYLVQLSVMDDWGATNKTSEFLLAGSLQGIGNSPPTPEFSIAVVDDSVSADASSSTDVDGEIVLFLWEFGDGSTYSGTPAAHNYGSPGDYDVSLTLYDDQGGTASLTKTVTIPNHRPSVWLSVTARSLRVYANASTTYDQDGDSLSFEWSFGDGGTALGYEVTHLFAAPGEYRVGLLVTDSAGAANFTAMTIAVTSEASVNEAPHIEVNWEVHGHLLRSTAEGSFDTDGEIVAIAWDFGDGTTATGTVVAHLYHETGPHTVTVRVLDDRGATSSFSFTAWVEPPLPTDSPPSARATLSVVDFDVRFDARGSSDDFGIAAYRWDFGDEDLGPDIAIAKTTASESSLYYYVEFSRDVSSLMCECSLDIFVDVDGSTSTGLLVLGRGAEFGIHVSIPPAGLPHAHLRWYHNPRYPGDTDAWAELHQLPFVFDGRRGEGVIRQSDLLQAEPATANLVALVKDASERIDTADVR